MADDVENDGSVSFAAGLITDLLKSAPAEDAPQETPANSPQAAPVADTAIPSEEPAEAAPEVPTAPVITAEPAKQPVESPELSTKLQEADRRMKEADAAKDQYRNALNTIVPQLEASIRGEFADIKNFADLQAIASTDPDRYNRYVIAMAQLNHAQQERDKAVQEDQRAQSQRLQEWKQQENQKLGTLIPELKDPDKGPVLARKIQDFALKSGYTAQQLSNASANDFAILHRAMQFDSLQAAQKAAKEKAADAPPVQKPGTAKTTGTKEDKLQTDFQRLQKTGRVDDAAAVFRNFVH